MKIEQLKVDRRSGCVVALSFCIPADEIQSQYKKSLGQWAGEVQLPGFRKGKAPANLVEQRYRDRIIGDLSERVTSAATWQAIEEAKIAEEDIITRPRLEKEPSVALGQPLELSASFSVIPDFAPKDYKGLKLKSRDAVATEDQISAELKELVGQHATLKPVDRAAKDGDVVIMDFHVTKADGSEVPNSKGSSVPTMLGSNRFIPGVEEGLVGVKAEETREIPVEFPADYHAEELRGLKATFHAKVQAVKEQVFPALDDEFAKDINFESFEKLKDHIKSMIESRLSEEIQDELEADLLQKLRAASPIADLPTVLLDDEVERRKEGFQQMLKRMRISLEQFFEMAKKTPQEHENEILSLARDTVHSSLVLRAIAKTEKVEVTDDELSRTIAMTAMRHNQSPEVLAKRLAEEGRLGLIKFDILKRKALKLVLENAEIEKSQQSASA